MSDDMTVNSGAGKGSKYRPVDKKKYDENFDKIFRNKEYCECDKEGTCFAMVCYNSCKCNAKDKDGNICYASNEQMGIGVKNGKD